MSIKPCGSSLISEGDDVRLLVLTGLVVCLCMGCTGWLIDALEERNVASCVWWNSAITGARSVSATGGATLAECLAVPCQGR